MKTGAIYCAGTGHALGYAAEHLRRQGYTVLSRPGPEICHVLLDVPTFRPGFPKTGDELSRLTEALPSHAVIWGGNLEPSDLGGHDFVDLLKDERYLAENAAITAECALKITGPMRKTVWSQTPTAVIGWGRIGKCLARQLRLLDCPVTVAVRNPVHAAALQALGYRWADTAAPDACLRDSRVIFNTVPAPVFSPQQTALCQNCIKIELASGNWLPGEDVVQASGLPGLYAPESSGRLIAETLIRILQEAAS